MLRGGAWDEQGTGVNLLNTKEIDHMGDVNLNGRIILKCKRKEHCVNLWTGFNSGYTAMRFRSIKADEFVDQLRGYQVLRTSFHAVNNLKHNGNYTYHLIEYKDSAFCHHNIFSFMILRISSVNRLVYVTEVKQEPNI
jgi:hypothetical protein